MKGCLLLNASYKPLTVLPLRRAVRLVVQNKAEIVEGDTSKPLRSADRSLPRPLVIKLVKFVKVPDKHRKGVTNTFLFARDEYRCMYCGKHDVELSEREGLTRDHIHPVSRGGTNTWENCATACSKCNHKKGDKTLDEAGMRLRKAPAVPDMVWLKWSVRSLTPLQRKYIDQFYGTGTTKEISG